MLVSSRTDFVPCIGLLATAAMLPPTALALDVIIHNILDDAWCISCNELSRLHGGSVDLNQTCTDLSIVSAEGKLHLQITATHFDTLCNLTYQIC